MLFADSALPLFLGNFSQWRLETSQVVHSGTCIAAQQVTEPAANISTCTLHFIGNKVRLYYVMESKACQPVLGLFNLQGSFTNG